MRKFELFEKIKNNIDVKTDDMDEQELEEEQDDDELGEKARDNDQIELPRKQDELNIISDISIANIQESPEISPLIEAKSNF